MELSLNVSQNIKRIKVNEAGEYIELNFDDQTLIPRLYSLIKDFDSVAAEHQEGVDALTSMPEETQQERSEKISAFAELQLKSCEKLMHKVDDAFMDSVCEKVFGNIVPSVAAFTEFFMQLGALISKFEADAEKSRFDRIRNTENVRRYTDKYHNKRG